MKFDFSLFLKLPALSSFLAVCGCSSSYYATTSPYHPGPVLGQTLGAGVGVVAGNVAGTAVGFGNGFVAGVAAPFDPTYQVIRQWRTETTSDGRTIQVPYDVLVDANGRPVNLPAPRK